MEDDKETSEILRQMHGCRGSDPVLRGRREEDTMMEKLCNLSVIN